MADSRESKCGDQIGRVDVLEVFHGSGAQEKNACEQSPPTGSLR